MERNYIFTRNIIIAFQWIDQVPSETNRSYTFNR